MKTLNLTSALFIVLIALGVACKKENAGDDRNNTVNSAKEFTAKFGAQKQSKEINASALPQTITFLDGTKVTFPVGSLTKGGVAVTGNVTVEVYEVLKRSAVIFTGANTNHSSGAPLVSDGFIFIDVKANGLSVDQNLAVPIKIAIPAKRDGATQLWVGVDQGGEKPLVAAAANQMAWAAPRNANGVGMKEVSASQSAFTFDFGNLGWVNCDTFYANSSPKTTVRVEVLNNPGTMASFHAYSGETFVYYCAKGANVVAQLYTPDGANKVKSYDNSMPIGSQGRMLSFSIKDGKFYYAVQDITISANQNLTMTLTETTEATIQAAISSLDNY
ncbi:hypothetical protein [Pedobacter nyackensis]|uniref:Uncharacterized protein n=1 Tax=Pedobacter nyackensis TaxID=475255 RepID=A0A1W2DNX7_9SPHI|nr:hypothetical protein [Pedobacter nyackensis]SMC98772.1 hypothetical protein SAMN04488101_107221 [Pedobacter nyackensis]